MLETSESWDRIKEAVKTRAIKEVATEFNVRPGEITAALLRAGVSRDPVPPAGAAPPRKGARRKPSSQGEPDVVNGLEVRPGTKDGAIAEHAEDLGREPDAVIAERVGVSARTVAAFRRRHGIKGRRGPKRSSAEGSSSKRTAKGALPPEKGQDDAPKSDRIRKAGPKSAIDPYAEQVGERPDSEIAELAGITTNAVAAWRRRRGIPPFKKSLAAGGSAKAAPAPEPKAAAKAAAKAAPRAKARASAGKGQGVYRVQLSGDEVAFVLADSLVEAAQAVEGRKGVLGVAWAGTLLA